MTNLLIVLALILVIAALVQIMRVNELLSELRKVDVNEVTDRDNDIQGKLFLIVGFGFIAFVIWQIFAWDYLLLPSAASEHGSQIDGLMKVTMGLILAVFFIVSPLLFYFVYKYRGNKQKKAFFYSHNDRLEIIWTVIPAIVLTGVIIYGLRTWDKAMNSDTKGVQVVEIYAKQFDWTARYSGDNNILGRSNYKLWDATDNPLSLDKLDSTGFDDMLTKELHLVKGRPILLKFRSQDVIHSAYLPHFRVQMNCVPGLTTQFAFTPTKTTEEMRSDPKIIKQMEEINEMRSDKGKDQVEFDYVLLCNKICGGAHYNMQMPVIVETEEAYNNWYKIESLLQSQKPQLSQIENDKMEIESKKSKIEKEQANGWTNKASQLDEEIKEIDLKLKPIQDINKGLKALRDSRMYSDLEKGRDYLEKEIALKKSTVDKIIELLIKNS